MYEDELIPMFEKCGKIWDLRLMMDPMSGLNRLVKRYILDLKLMMDSMSGLNRLVKRYILDLKLIMDSMSGLNRLVKRYIGILSSKWILCLE